MIIIIEKCIVIKIRTVSSTNSTEKRFEIQYNFAVIPMQLQHFLLQSQNSSRAVPVQYWYNVGAIFFLSFMMIEKKSLTWN